MIGPMRGPRVLIAEDDRALRELLCEWLEAEGFETVAAANGAEALALLRAGQACDALLTDDEMPQLRGSELVSILRAEGRALPVVLMSGSLGLSPAERARLDVGPVIPKPITLPRLLSALRLAVGEPQ
jgi:two-component system cell cycle response regulator CpdR